MRRARAAERSQSLAPTPPPPGPSSVWGTHVGQRFIVNPTTSCPSATIRAAATALSTPPLIATATRAIGASVPRQKGVSLHAFPPGAEPLPDLPLVSLEGRLVVRLILDVLRHVLLRHKPARVIMRIHIPGPVTEPRRPGIR